MTVVFPPAVDLTLIFGVGCLALALLGFAAARRLRTKALGRVVVMLRLPALAVGTVMTMSTLFATTPDSHLANPIPPTVTSISVGEGVYLNNCAACHGADARGGGQLSGTTPVRPPALTGPGSHLGQHTDGDLHYFIGQGLSGGMPAWADRLSDEQIWDIINFLRSLEEAP
jgi:putative copper resistance protein D